MTNIFSKRAGSSRPQKRKSAGRRMRKALRKLEEVAVGAVVYLQEMGPGSVEMRSHKFYGWRAGKNSAIGVPTCMTT